MPKPRGPSAMLESAPTKLPLSPPQLVLRQAAALALHAWLTGWRGRALFRWAYQLRNPTHASAGAEQISCFGVSPHVVWEATGRCNLRCVHCHARGGEAGVGELTKGEAMALIDRVASAGIRTFVFSGGEPLLREDLFELIRYAKSRGLSLFIATNGTLISRRVARLLKRYGVGAVIGVDSLDPEVHDSIRGVRGALEAALEGVENCASEGVYVHLNIVAFRGGLREVERVIDYGNAVSAYSYFVYNFVPFGRGEAVPEGALEGEGLEALFNLLLRKQRGASGIIVSVAAPEYWAYLLRRRGVEGGRLVRLAGRLIGGCLADKGMVYVKTSGDVWPCPFLPISAGNAREARLDRILERLRPLRLGLRLLSSAARSGCKVRMLLKYACPVGQRLKRGRAS